MRNELLVRIAAARFALERGLAALDGSNTGSRAAGNASLADLAALQQSVTTADPASLIAMRAEVAGAAAAVAARADQMQTAAAASAGAEAARSLADARSASRNAVAAIMGGMHDFDDQLRFASSGDAETYRQREAERRAYVAAQQAKGTPEGDLNASAGALGQMADAKAYGAGGPEFDKRWNELVATTERLREQVQRSGGSTQAFDDRLREDLRAILKSKGLSDPEIAARFAANPDPLEAVKAYMKVDADMAQVSDAARGAAIVAAPVSAAATSPVTGSTVDDPIARLQAAGRTVASCPR